MAADSLNSKTAFIAIVGCPNVGKSSLLNRFLGEKVAIVSPKPQTTRTRIMGVLTDGATQLVFTDTPGYHKPKNKLGENMIRAVGEGINDVDACLLVVEPSGDIRPEEQTLIKKIKKIDENLFENADFPLAICTFSLYNSGKLWNGGDWP